MKSRKPPYILASILIVPFALIYLYQFGYLIVDLAYGVNSSNCNLD